MGSWKPHNVDASTVDVVGGALTLQASGTEGATTETTRTQSRAGGAIHQHPLQKDSRHSPTWGRTGMGCAVHTTRQNTAGGNGAARELRRQDG
eukprot:3156894-Rhodomonas_salina.1